MSKKSTETDMEAVVAWLAKTPDTEDLFKTMALCSMGNEPDYTLDNDVLAELYSFVSNALTSLAMLRNIHRGFMRIGLKDGELAFSLSEQGREWAKKNFGDIAKQATMPAKE